MNSISISGNLVAQPELKTTQNGISVCTFTVAVSRPNVKDKTDFIDCVVWRERAEFVSKYFNKGDRIEVGGHIETRTYEDSKGNKRKAVEVLADFVSFGSKKSDSSTRSESVAGNNYKGENTNEAHNATEWHSEEKMAGGNNNFQDLNEDEDLPF